MSLEPLLRLVKTLAWLDAARWGGKQPDNVALRLVNDAGPADCILAHWLAYITDRMRPWEQAWWDGALVFSRVATDYAREKPTPQDVNALLQRYRDQPSQGNKQPAWRAHDGDDVTYTTRFPADDGAIYRTLRLLARSDWSLVGHIQRWVDAFRERPDGLRRVAHCLDILTYQLKLPEERALDLLSDADALSAEFDQWDRFGHKRLWAALRDYRKPGSRWLQYLNDCGLIWPNENFGLEQLELPGDVWNTRFFKFLVSPLATEAGLDARGAQLARRIHEAVVKEDASVDFYPEQFDISFDFASRMCDARACWFCPFWKSRPPFISTSTELCRKEQGKPCGLMLLTSGYLAKSEPQACPFCQGIAAGLCDGLISHVRECG